jgi:hypothetical protein
MLRNNLELEPDPGPKLTVKSDPDPKEKLRIHNTALNFGKGYLFSVVS